MSKWPGFRGENVWKGAFGGVDGRIRGLAFDFVSKETSTLWKHVIALTRLAGPVFVAAGCNTEISFPRFFPTGEDTQETV